MKRKFIISVFAWLLAMPLCLFAQVPSVVDKSDVAASSPNLERPEQAIVDSNFVVSLLTCSPGQELYELYGHTALRVCNQAYGLDEVFNYGAFSFEQPHFVARFVLGRCDYMVVSQSLQSFLYEYARRGSSVTEQVLNLLPIEAQELSLALLENIKPQNCVYRYNIFRNNCTIKARDMIEAHVRGEVRYPAYASRNTFRTILHEYTMGHEWAREGNDFLLGASVDTAIYERDEMFAPEYMMHYADSAFIDAGPYGMRPLVSATNILLPADPDCAAAEADKLPSVPFSPRAMGWGLLLLGLLIACYEVVRSRLMWPVDAVLMTLQGIVGVLLVFMALLSEHPGVGSNWQVWVFNPLPLFFLPFVVKADIKRERSVYHAFACVWLLSFVVLNGLLPQHFSSMMLPLALLLLSRAVVHLLVYKRWSRV